MNNHVPGTWVSKGSYLAFLVKFCKWVHHFLNIASQNWIIHIEWTLIKINTSPLKRLLYTDLQYHPCFRWISGSVKRPLQEARPRSEACPTSVVRGSWNIRETTLWTRTRTLQRDPGLQLYILYNNNYMRYNIYIYIISILYIQLENGADKL